MRFQSGEGPSRDLLRDCTTQSFKKACVQLHYNTCSVVVTHSSLVSVLVSGTLTVVHWVSVTVWHSLSVIVSYTVLHRVRGA